MANATPPWWVGKSKDELIDEIKSLRSENSAMRESEGRFVEEVSLLRVKLAEKDKLIEEQDVQLSASIMRVKELERGQGLNLPKEADEPLPSKLVSMYAITDDQIDKAWRCYEDVRSTSCCAAVLRAAFYELGIGACKDCGGSGEFYVNGAWSADKCPTCHGHGWRKNG